MISALPLYHKKFRKDIESIIFEVNTYDTYVSNRMVNRKKHTVAWNVDDLKSSHVDTKVNDDFHKWLEKKFGSDDILHVEASRGKVHKYLAMNLDYTEEGKLKIDMSKYLDAMIAEFPHKLSYKVKCTWTENIFKVEKEEKKLGYENMTIFNLFVVKTMSQPNKDVRMYILIFTFWI